MNAISTLIGALLSIILYPLIIPFIEEPAHKLLSLIIGKHSGIFVKKKNRLAGKWMQVWVVDESRNFPKENEAEVAIYQLGKKVFGRINSNDKSYIIKGSIDKDMFLTGTWEDYIDGNNYNGAFQLYIHKYGTHMTGKWVGFSELNKIKTGDWYWRRIEESEYKSAK